MLKTLRDPIAGDGKTADATLVPEPMLVKEAVRVSSEGRAIDFDLGKQTLRLYPEIRITAGAKADGRDWILVDPGRFFSAVAGFARLECGQTALVGRDNERLSKIFDFPKSVARRRLVLVNDDGQIIINPLDSDRKTYVSSVPESEDVDWFAARRLKNLKRLRTIFGGPIRLLGPDQAMAAPEQAHAILLDEACRPKDSQNDPVAFWISPESRRRSLSAISTHSRQLAQDFQSGRLS